MSAPIQRTDSQTSLSEIPTDSSSTQRTEEQVNTEAAAKKALENLQQLMQMLNNNPMLRPAPRATIAPESEQQADKEASEIQDNKLERDTRAFVQDAAGSDQIMFSQLRLKQISEDLKGMSNNFSASLENRMSGTEQTRGQYQGIQDTIKANEEAALKEMKAKGVCSDPEELLKVPSVKKVEESIREIVAQRESPESQTTADEKGKPASLSEVNP